MVTTPHTLSFCVTHTAHAYIHTTDTHASLSLSHTHTAVPASPFPRLSHKHTATLHRSLTSHTYIFPSLSLSLSH